MTFILGATSRARLARVHPQLVAVVELAITLTTVDFMVLEGVRTRERMCEVYGQGRSGADCVAKGVPASFARPGMAKVTWLNDPFASNHRLRPDGFGHAVDLVPYPVDWNDLARFDAVATAMFKAADQLGVHIRWGADWDEDGRPRERGESDSPHFELAA